MRFITRLKSRVHRPTTRKQWLILTGLVLVGVTLVSGLAYGLTRDSPPPKHVNHSTQPKTQTKITLVYQTKKTVATKADIDSWYTGAGDSRKLDDTKLQAYVSKVGGNYGITVQNLAQAVAIIKEAVQKHRVISFELTAVAVPPPAPVAAATPAPAAKTFTYCTATRGVDASYLPELEAKLASTYGDSRGWNLGGQVSFVKAASNCNFTVWLTAADQMPTFGAICDSTWSCTVSPNVVLNFDRWQGASSAWTGGGGNLDDYRSMVINHETGHWLGFYHKFCGGAGQAAPVMQQQSIDLQGCTANPWPLPAERDQLRQHLGL